ncbi:MAG: hypothetical protein JWM93_3242 [Frankiales bacterium]|nr:hypothetical protein [Frankiales bacterium]
MSMLLLFLRGTSERGSLLAPLSLYLATLILGAGVFLLPLEAAQVGLLPLLAMLVLILWPCIRLYQRVAALMVRRDGRSPGGGEALARAVVEAGGGRPAALLSLTGILVYVGGAAVVYNRLGLPSLELLAAQLRGSVLAGVTAAIVSAAGLSLSLSRRLPARRVVLRRLLTVTSVWGIATPLIAVLDGHAIVGKTVGLVAFAIGCVLVSRAPAPREAAERAPGTLAAGHSSSIAGLGLQLVLMMLIAGTAIVLVALPGGHGIHWNAVWVSDDFHPSALLGAAAVILFAHVGTGMSNVADYPEMASAAFRRSAVRASLIIVTAVLVAWLIPMTLVFGHEGLMGLVDAKTNSALGLPTALAASGTAVNSVLSVLSALVTLIAVTNANAGFITSLARELIGAKQELCPSSRPLPREGRLSIALVVALTGVAGAAIAMDDALAPMLHIAGIVGGGVIVFTLPLLAEEGDRSRRLRFGVSAIAVAAALGVWATAAALTEGHTAAVVRALMVAVGWSPLIPTILAARGVIAAGGKDGPAAVPAPTGPFRPTPPTPVTAMSARREQTRS